MICEEPPTLPVRVPRSVGILKSLPHRVAEHLPEPSSSAPALRALEEPGKPLLVLPGLQQVVAAVSEVEILVDYSEVPRERLVHTVESEHRGRAQVGLCTHHRSGSDDF